MDDQEIRNDSNSQVPKAFVRKERTKSREMAKKQGGGKKGMWGKIEDQIDVPSVDRGDPNFDSEGEENVVFVTAEGDEQFSNDYRETNFNYGPNPKLSLREFKQSAISILDEYFVSGDIDEVARSLSELDSTSFHYEFVKRAITMSMDKHEKERELVSRLLSELYENLLKTEQIGKAFERLFEVVDDLELDIPNARTILSTFLARAVVDELLPPSFLSDRLVVRIGGDVVEVAKKKLSINHGTVRLEKGWGPGDGRPVEELKVSIDQLLQEYLLSNDLHEAARCVRELKVSQFHHEVVKRAIVNAMDKDKSEQQVMSSLLAYLVTQEVVSTEQLLKGFDRIKEGMSDLLLDYPYANKVLNEFIERAKSDGVLSTKYEGI